ncbi:hypothetical protein G4B88_028564 [Cannabis sativa]|uniref:Cytochrome P450 n=1 Tax=Cannabis sativa TaxID=3483 RepID=A0A7J6F1Q7_CANSA|nr:hypothetical protein G4B88_028564 [Cannabis sativa]
MEEIIIITITIIIFTIFFFKITKTNKTQYKNPPPSPPSYPIIGHLHLLTKQPIHRALQKLSTQYGDVFSLQFGSRHVAIISSPSAVEECFTKNDIVLANRPLLIMGKHVGYNYTNIVNAPYGHHWRNLRRIATVEILSSTRLNLFLDIRKDEILRLLRQFSGAGGGWSRVELRSKLTEMSFNIIMRMMAGKRYYGDDVAEEARRFREVMKEVLENAGAENPADFLPVLKWIPINNYEKRVERLGKKADLFLQGLIEEHRNRKDGGDRNTVIDHLLTLQESQPEYYSDQIIKGFVLILLMAGSDTSAVTLEWAMSNLLNHPRILQKVRDELDSQVGQQQLLEESNLTKLSYLRNVIFETLRLYPAAPLLIPHYSSSDCTISGFDVPRNTMVIVNAWAIQRDPKFWEDPEIFKPERFESNNISETEGYKFMPFGVGRRACPGIGLAERVVGLTLGSLIQCFEWENISKEKVDMSEGKGLTMPKAVPLEAMCKPCPIMDVLFS